MHAIMIVYQRRSHIYNENREEVHKKLGSRFQRGGNARGYNILNLRQCAEAFCLEKDIYLPGPIYEKRDGLITKLAVLSHFFSS